MTLIEQLDAVLNAYDEHDCGFSDAECARFLTDNAPELRAALKLMEAVKDGVHATPFPGGEIDCHVPMEWVNGNVIILPAEVVDG